MGTTAPGVFAPRARLGEPPAPASTFRSLRLKLDELVDHDVVDYLATQLAEVITRARKRMEHTTEYDDVTNDLVIEVVSTLEEQHWMIRAPRE